MLESGRVPLGVSASDPCNRMRSGGSSMVIEVGLTLRNRDLVVGMLAARSRSSEERSISSPMS